MTLSTIGGASPATKANDNLDFLNDPLLPGEDREKYQQLLTLIGETIKPRDVFEQFWVADVANQVWETVRYRVVTLGLIAVRPLALLRRFLAPSCLMGLGTSTWSGQAKLRKWPMSTSSAKPRPSKKFTRCYKPLGWI